MTKSLELDFAFIIGSLLIGSCVPSGQVDATPTPASPTSDIEEAQGVLIEYFNDLYTGEFDAAADLFGGDLEQLIDWNADINPSDPVALFDAACSRQLQCLQVRTIVAASQVDQNTFQFKLEFNNSDGSLFVLGPCCGATETEMPSVSEFDCSVEKTNGGNYKVMCLPVYVP
jgi:hypothetical protein